jgi:hypothetical protein
MKAISFSYPCLFVNGKAIANTLFEARTAHGETPSLFGVPPLSGFPHFARQLSHVSAGSKTY